MNSKKRFLLFLLIFFIGSVAWAQNSQKTFKVVIDAGHGGADGGCVSVNGAVEKDINLNILRPRRPVHLLPLQRL